MKKMKQFLNKNQPDNILNYVDVTNIWSIEPGFKRWYEADPKRKESRLIRFVYGIILAKPKIERWVADQLFTFHRATDKIFRKVWR